MTSNIQYNDLGMMERNSQLADRGIDLLCSLRERPFLLESHHMDKSVIPYTILH